LTRDSKKFNSLGRNGKHGMPHYMMADNASQKSHGSSSGGGGYTNGHSGGVSPNSSQLSMDGRESTLITRTQKQHITQNVTTTTKTIREVQYIGPDGLPIDFIPGQQGSHEQHAGEGGRGAQQTAGQAGAGDSWV